MPPRRLLPLNACGELVSSAFGTIQSLPGIRTERSSVFPPLLLSKLFLHIIYRHSFILFLDCGEQCYLVIRWKKVRGFFYLIISLKSRKCVGHDVTSPSTSAMMIHSLLEGSLVLFFNVKCRTTLSVVSAVTLCLIFSSFHY